MLKLLVNAQEVFNEETNEFSFVGGWNLELEHSLISLSKWESKFKKPFLAAGEKTTDEILHYILCMVISPEVNLEKLMELSKGDFDRIQEYIESTESATTFGEMPKTRGKGETVTSELIYYWMSSFGIPFETELWHLNRLFSLIRICNIKNTKQKPKSRAEIIEHQRAENARRRQLYGTKG